MFRGPQPVLVVDRQGEEGGVDVVAIIPGSIGGPQPGGLAPYVFQEALVGWESAFVGKGKRSRSVDRAVE
jgi:hypothetical protein